MAYKQKEISGSANYQVRSQQEKKTVKVQILM